MRVYVESTKKKILNTGRHDFTTGTGASVVKDEKGCHVNLSDDLGRPPELPFDPKEDGLKVVRVTIIKRTMPSPILHAGRYKRGRATGQVEFEPPQVTGQSPRAVITVEASTVKTAWQLCQDILDGTIRPEVDRGNVHGRIRPAPKPEPIDWPLTNEVLLRHLELQEHLRLRLAMGGLKGNAKVLVKCASVYPAGIEYQVYVIWFRECNGRVDRVPEGMYDIVAVKGKGVRLCLTHTHRANFEILGPAAE